MRCPIPSLPKRIFGASIALYECAALLLDRRWLPPITHLCHRWLWLAVACVAWVAVHLLRPWIRNGR